MAVYPAAVTPFDAKGRVDMLAVARLLAWYRAGDCTGIVFAGTNGEGPSLSATEKRDLVREGVKLAGSMPVILGVATASLEEAVWSCRQAGEAGAEAALVMPPGYFRDVSEEGIAQWFETLFSRVSIPVIVYNFPQRTGITLSATLMGRLAQHERMIGLKDSSGNRDNLASYAAALAGLGKVLYVGDETLLIEALRAGWTGTISGAANVLPSWLSQIVREWPTDPESAETKHALILPTIQALRRTPQPGGNKQLLHRLGILENPLPRLPILPPTPESVDEAWSLVSSLTH